MKRMTSKQIELEAGKIFGATWKKREKVGTLTEQLQSALEAADLPKMKKEMVVYLIDCAGDLA